MERRPLRVPARNRRLANPQVARFRGGEIAPGRACAVWLKVDAPELSSGPIWEIQEVSRVGAQPVTSKSKLLARQMPRVCSRGLWVDSVAAKLLKVAAERATPRRCAAGLSCVWTGAPLALV